MLETCITIRFGKRDSGSEARAAESSERATSVVDAYAQDRLEIFQGDIFIFQRAWRLSWTYTELAS